MSFPAAHYLIASSRLHPGLDGGYTISVMRRAQQLREQGGISPQLLTVDLADDYETHRAKFRELGLADDKTILRNLFEEARTDPTWLWAAAAEVDVAPNSTTVLPEVSHIDHLGLDGSVLLRTPQVAQPDWHHTSRPITVFRDGEPIVALYGFGGLYRAWMRHVIGTLDTSLPVVIIAESRQVGELLRPLRSERVRLVHTVHNAHTRPPHNWDSPVDQLWGGWLATLDEYDAVVHLTSTQRDDVARRWPTTTLMPVIPHGIEPVPASTRGDNHDPHRIAMIARLVPQKQVDHAIRAVARLTDRGVLVNLDVYGEGPDRSELEGLVRELGVTASVAFHGHVPDASARIGNAAALLLSSRYEGFGLVIVEAFRIGVPVVAYDINYGPRDTIEHSVSGLLVPAGDINALTDALAQVIENAELRARLAAGALAAADCLAPPQSCCAGKPFSRSCSRSFGSTAAPTAVTATAFFASKSTDTVYRDTPVDVQFAAEASVRAQLVYLKEQSRSVEDAVAS